MMTKISIGRFGNEIKLEKKDKEINSLFRLNLNIEYLRFIYLKTALTAKKCRTFVA